MSTATRILVLGLLADGPKHGYEIRRWLETSEAELWTDVKRGSVYHALGSLERAGHAEVVDDASTPARTTYRLTDAGRSELRTLLRHGWQDLRGSYPRGLYTLLTFADPVPLEELRALRDRLREELHVWEKGTEAKRDLPNARLVAALMANGRAHLEADLALLDELSAAEPPFSPPS